MSSLALYRSRVPAHVDIDDADVTNALEDAVALHNYGAFGSVYGNAMVYYAAHLIQLMQDEVRRYEEGTSTTGAVTSRRTGKRAETYAQPPANQREYVRWITSTPYGVRYWAIVKTRKATFGRFVRPG